MANPTEPIARILIAEDEQFIRDVYVEMLNNEGFAVDVAVDGKQALEKLQVGGYDLVLLDIMMPFIDGLGVLMKLKETPAQNPNKHIVICTSLAADPAVKDALDHGAEDVVFKPDVTPDQLVAKVKKVLASSNLPDHPVNGTNN